MLVTDECKSLHVNEFMRTIFLGLHAHGDIDGCVFAVDALEFGDKYVDDGEEDGGGPCFVLDDEHDFGVCFFALEIDKEVGEQRLLEDPFEIIQGVSSPHAKCDGRGCGGVLMGQCPSCLGVDRGFLALVYMGRYMGRGWWYTGRGWYTGRLWCVVRG